MKWTKVTKEYQEKYIEFIRLFFDFVARGRIKIRTMFTQNYHRPNNLTDEHRDKEYYLLLPDAQARVRVTALQS